MKKRLKEIEKYENMNSNNSGKVTINIIKGKYKCLIKRIFSKK